MLPFPPPIHLIGGCKIPPDCVPLVQGSQATFLLNTIQDLTWLSLSLFPGILLLFRAFLVAQTVKGLPAMRETWVQSLGQEDPLEKEMATHCSILAWRIPWTEEPGGL